MLNVLKFEDVLRESFYLDDDDITIRRKIDGYYGRYKKHDVVEGYYQNTPSGKYEIIHIPKTRTSIKKH